VKVLLAYARSDVGMVRERNEDSYICRPPLFMVADGMGGHVAGEVASRMAVDVVAGFFASGAGQGEPDALLGAAIAAASAAIFRTARDKEEWAGMGTTATAAYVEGARLYWGHVGDSRLYLLRAGEFRQLTRDHSLVGELVKNGNITIEEALLHPHRNVLTRAVGTGEAVEVDTGRVDLLPGDLLLLCTDGLTNMVSDEEVAAVLQGGPASEQMLAELVGRANAAGGLDNITLILLQPGDG